MSSIAFIVPAYQRFELTRLCLEELAETCAELALVHHIEATAVVIADDKNLDAAYEFDFWGIKQENEPLGRKFNDGFELAATEIGAEYVIPIGTDNWVHPDVVCELPPAGRVLCRRSVAIVREDGQRLSELEITYDGGDGIRTFPTSLFAKTPVPYRPAADHARRAVDTSIIERLRRFSGWHGAYDYQETNPLDIVGFQSWDVQLNDYEGLKRTFGKREYLAPWERLALRWDQGVVDRMREFFERRLVVVK